jgi:hypothetical protein
MHTFHTKQRSSLKRTGALHNFEFYPQTHLERSFVAETAQAAMGSINSL